MKTQQKEGGTNTFPRIIKGRKLKNKSLKLIETRKGEFIIISNTYFYGIKVRSKHHRFMDLPEADAFYEKLAFARFGYLA